jgi:RNA-directed DNA polymerase
MAKTYDKLWDDLTSFGNLHQAFKASSKGKRSKPEVAAFEYELETKLLNLQTTLQTGKYRPSAYRSFLIFDPKRRLVSAAPFADRVVHHALMQLLEPIFERTFIGDSYANRVGKGTHAALERAQRWVREYRYVLQCDIKQFFPSVDHVVLYSLLATKIACPRTLQLAKLILDSGDGVLAAEYEMVYFEGDDLLSLHRPRGLPIGNLTSQCWANVYMNEVDQLVKRQLHCTPYLRYVDDFLLFSNDKAELWAHKKAIVGKLNALRLTLHDASSTVYPTKNGVGFLGMRLFGTFKRLKNRNVRAFDARLRGWQQLAQDGDMSLADMQTRVQGWVAHAEHADTRGLREQILGKPWQLRPK